MKRLIALLLALVMTFVLCACGETAPETGAATAEETAEPTSEPTAEPIPEITIQDGIDYYRGENGKEKDLEKAREIFESFGEDNAEAQCYLGDIEYDNNNLDAAIVYYENAAELGYSAAAYELGYVYGNVRKDIEKASYYYDLASEAGDLSAAELESIGCFFSLNGNKEKAFEYYLKSNEKDSTYCLSLIGSYYLYGDVVEADYEKAFNYYTRAVEAGDTSALVKLGTMYMGGIGVERDMDKAVELFEQAAELGVPNAEKNLENARFFQSKGIKPTITFN